MMQLHTAALAALTLASPFFAATSTQDVDDRTRGRQDATKEETTEKIKPYELGAKVDPEISLPGIDGKTYRLGDLQEKIVVLDFWSIQCPWSKKYEERLLDLHARYGKKDVVFLAIDANHAEVDWDGEKPYARIQAYVEKAEVTYPILIDEGNLVADLFGGMTTPHIFILDKGKLAYRGGIDSNPQMDEEKETVNYVADALDALLAGEKVETAETKPMGCSIKRVKKDRLQ